MAKIVYITESDYREILQWQDDGGADADVIYVIIPDEQLELDIDLKQAA